MKGLLDRAVPKLVGAGLLAFLLWVLWPYKEAGDAARFVCGIVVLGACIPFVVLFLENPQAHADNVEAEGDQPNAERDDDRGQVGYGGVAGGVRNEDQQRSTGNIGEASRHRDHTSGTVGTRHQFDLGLVDRELAFLFARRKDPEAVSRQGRRG